MVHDPLDRFSEDLSYVREKLDDLVSDVGEVRLSQARSEGRIAIVEDYIKEQKAAVRVSRDHFPPGPPEGGAAMNLDFTKSLVPVAVLGVLGALVYKGILHPEALLTIVGILIPSPLSPKPAKGAS